jgi:hypothetical protein
VPLASLDATVTANFARLFSPGGPSNGGAEPSAR